LSVVARTILFHNIEAVQAKDERDGLREAKPALDQKLFYLFVPEPLRFLIPHTSFELIKVIASSDGMREKADHRVDHRDQQLPLALENPPAVVLGTS
jgi:hypothetical protein